MLTTSDLQSRLERLNAIGIALSGETNINGLMETILVAAKSLVGADAGTLYLRRDEMLHFEIVMTDSLGIALGGTTGKAVSLPPVPLQHVDGSPNRNNVVACAVLEDCTINIEDAYTAEGYDFSGTRKFDQSTGYRSQSFLTVPMKNHEHEIIGVLQLINPTGPDGKVHAFSAEDQRLVESLASQAAIALTNRQLIRSLEELFEAFINLINLAIDDKSPYTGGHCQRVPELTLLIADAVNRTHEGALADFSMNERDRYELKIAGMLHDCGKVTTPVHVVDKGTKLQTLFDRIELVEARLEILRRDIELACVRGEIDAAERDAQWAQVEEDRVFLLRANAGGEFMRDEDVARVAAIAGRSWIAADGAPRPLLTADEVENLSIRKGTLTDAERQIINHHVEVTIQMLQALPWPKHLKNVTEFAGGHHERMDGKGYPRGLTRDQMSVQARIMGVADVFEALTACDRPYKHGMKLSQSLTILARMVNEGHIDPDIFEVFLREKVWLDYARRYLHAEQADEVDVEQLLRIAHGEAR
ncbi:HD-GYP domain, c-di-GMP phosphodiesterase class II (or its inactivated variant) [Formivibrio citricus]|uniref:HD-GYP domain, c-di-GMP phosphodiesterase class II (Or its inactivated variant) n=1 Tax=Formivibrio citricus TaxID=83765 RepID=A0A1I4XTJ5_9NEIS|nr:HD family phosphohydrolase [Formivibrio citricus]SFN29124.1 HD-GYP domain, c-di-GMP phosphodiesterase class II (or its inactivated variant) [Formivibrio citricus]